MSNLTKTSLVDQIIENPQSFDLMQSNNYDSYFYEDPFAESLLMLKLPLMEKISLSDLQVIAQGTEGFTGADLKALLYTAQLRRIDQQKKITTGMNPVTHDPFQK